MVIIIILNKKKKNGLIVDIFILGFKVEEETVIKIRLFIVILSSFWFSNGL